MFEQIADLPLHPLVVHAVVVLVPLSAVGALALALRLRWAPTFGPLVAAAAVGAAVAAFVAHQAGEALYAWAGYAGHPVKAEPLVAHARWGLGTVVSAVVLALLAVAAAVLARLDASAPVTRVVAAAAAVAGVVATTFTVLAGHSGASSAWYWLVGT